MLKFVGNKIGLELTKFKSNKVTSTQLNRRDTELLADARVKIMLRK